MKLRNLDPNTIERSYNLSLVYDNNFMIYRLISDTVEAKFLILLLTVSICLPSSEPLMII